jgi:hypothetical protein
MVNVGQLVRERHKVDGVVLVGFGSHRGSVHRWPGMGCAHGPYARAPRPTKQLGGRLAPGQVRR